MTDPTTTEGRAEDPGESEGSTFQPGELDLAESFCQGRSEEGFGGECDCAFGSLWVEKGG